MKDSKLNGTERLQKSILALVFAFLFLSGCNNKDGPVTTKPEPFISSRAVKDYLANNVGESGFGGKVFCAYEQLGTKRGADAYQTELFVWAMCEEYRLEKGSLVPGTGMACPLALMIEKPGDQYRIISHKRPRDGSFYGKDIQAIFPESIWSRISPSTNECNARTERLRMEIEKEAIDYFKPKWLHSEEGRIPSTPKE